MAYRSREFRISHFTAAKRYNTDNGDRGGHAGGIRMDIKKKRGFRGQRAKIAARGGPRVQKNPDITNRDRFAQRLSPISGIRCASF